MTTSVPSGSCGTDELAGLRASYAARLPERLRAIETLVSQVMAGAPESALELYHEVHRLTGSAATYGFSALSQASRELEDAIDDRLSGRDRGTTDAEGDLRRRLEILKQAVRDV